MPHKPVTKKTKKSADRVEVTPESKRMLASIAKARGQTIKQVVTDLLEPYFESERREQVIQTSRTKVPGPKGWVPTDDYGSRSWTGPGGDGGTGSGHGRMPLF